MNILLIDDHELVRFGLGKLLQGLGSQMRVLEAASLARGSAIYSEERGEIALVLLDLNLPDSRGLIGVRQFIQKHPGARVAVLSGTVDEAIADEARSMGAIAFLHKSSDIERLYAKLADIVNKIPRESTVSCAARDVPECSGIERQLKLSSRELRILDLLLQGNNNQEIAAAMGLALGTAKNYVSGIFAAFGVTSRARLIALFH